ncbi:MAG: hypothetical protein ACM31C_31015 [Acidobacteriota bacterium]
MSRLFVILLALGACRDSQEARLAKVKDAVCACKTAACGEAALKDVPQKDIKSNHKNQQIAREMLDCLAKLYDADHAAAAPGDDDGDATDPGTEAPASAGTR